jgi:hypothetical protein
MVIFSESTLFSPASSAVSPSTVLEDTGIEPRTVATLALAAYLFSDKYEVTRI